MFKNSLLMQPKTHKTNEPLQHDRPKTTEVDITYADITSMGNFRKKEKNLAGQRKDASEAHRAAEGRSQVLGDQQESAQVHRQLIAVAN